MSRRLKIAFGGFLILVLSSATPPSLFAEGPRAVVYRLQFPEPSKHVLDVEMTIPTENRETIELRMAEWSPGFYRVEHYASRVLEAAARTTDGKPLPLDHPQPNHWRIAAQGLPAVVLTYRLKCEERSVTTNWVGTEYAVLNGPATFITLTDNGRRPHEVHVALPGTWKRAVTALDPAPDAQPNHFRAEDFDTLADSPILVGNPVLASFEVDGAKHLVAGVGDTDRFDAQRAARDLERIVREHRRMWGQVPFKNYVFLLAFRSGGGGLEHRHSTLITTNPAGIQTPAGYARWLALVSHEYFHAYNVKRLRPIELGPFDYEKAPRTTGLWVAEGLTTYYGDLIPSRAGLAKPEQFLKVLSSHIQQLQTSPGRRVQTLEEASLNVWTASFSGVGSSPTTVSYYIKGPVVGFLLDAHLRRASGGTQSLDDLMRLAYQGYSGGRGFTAEEFRKTAEEIGGLDLGPWFRRALASTEELNYDEALDWFGLRFAPAAGNPAEPSWQLEPRPDASAEQQARLTAWLNPAAAGEAAIPANARARRVSPPPEALFAKFPEADRAAARQFYAKYLDIKGVPVLASADVADRALERTADQVTHLLAGRPDILGAMAKFGTRLIIIGRNQVYTDMPEYRHHPHPAYQNERVRGTGGLDVTSFGEENLLNLPLDRYDDESIAVHEFCHTIDAALARLEPDWPDRLARTYRHAMEQGLWKNAYTASNPAEYWAEICQSYFDCNRVNNWNHTAIGTREQLKRYDPEGYALVQTTFRLTPASDWRYAPLRRQPSVGPVPSKYSLDPYYLKFTLAREFPIVGSKHVSDEALLRANDAIRKMFAYRHDILKALIEAGARLVVLGQGERLGDLPELAGARAKSAGLDVRYWEYEPESRLMVVPEENVLGLANDPFAGESLLVHVLAKGLYRLTAARPVDPEFDRRPNKQQYELRVKRLDVEFGRAVRQALDQAAAKGIWRGSPAARDPMEYWAAGVEAYFDAAGQGYAPQSADRPITTREALRQFDPELFALVDEIMAYRGHVDWRWGRR